MFSHSIAAAVQKHRGFNDKTLSYSRFELSHTTTLKHLSWLILLVPLHLFLFVGSRFWLAKSNSWLANHKFGLAKIPCSICQIPIVVKQMLL